VAKIAQTRLGTSDVPGDICNNAFALFPAVGTIRAGASFAEKNNNLLNKKPQLAMFRLTLSSGVTVLAGICGPGYGIRFEAAGETTGNTVSLAVSNDDTAAGFFAGYKVSLGITCKLEQWHLIGGWKPVFNLSPGFSVDLLNLLVELIKELVGGNGKVEDGVEVTEGKDDKKQDKKKGGGRKVKSIAIYDFVTGQFAEKGSITVTPSYDLPLNIAAMIPQLKPFIAALKAWWGDFSFGPQISLMLPTTIQLAAIEVNGARYGNLAFSKGKFTGTSDQPAGGDPKRLGVTLVHRPGFDLGLSFFVEISVCKFFKLGGSTPKFPLLALLGIVVKTGPFPNTLQNDVGRKTVAGLTCPPGDSSQWAEVILEPTAAVHG